MSKLPITLKKIKELEVAARRYGTVEKRAIFSSAKQEYDRLKHGLFDDEFPYAELPNEAYVEELRKVAESGEEVAVYRYEMMKERRDLMDRSSRGDDVKELRASVSELRQLLQSGQPVTEAHLKSATQAAMENGSIDNRVLYSDLKTRRQAQLAGTFVKEQEQPPEQVNVTEEDVDAASEKARISGRMEDRVTYSTLKTQLFKQQQKETASQN